MKFQMFIFCVRGRRNIHGTLHCFWTRRGRGIAAVAILTRFRSRVFWGRPKVKKKIGDCPPAKGVFCVAILAKVNVHNHFGSRGDVKWQRMYVYMYMEEKVPSFEPLLDVIPPLAPFQA